MSGADFARFYEAQYTGYALDTPLWLHLAAETGGPVLDLGCGTGRVALALAQAGYFVAGLDVDPAMLSRARRHLSGDLASRVTLHLTDLRAFALDRRFRLAVSACNTFASLDDDAVTSAARCVSRHLAPGGLLALDLPNARDSLDLPEDDSEPVAAFLEPETGHPIQVSALQAAIPECRAVDVTWYYDELFPDGGVERTRVPLRYYLRTARVMRDLLLGAGFTRVETFGTYALGRLRPRSARMIVLAHLGSPP